MVMKLVRVIAIASIAILFQSPLVYSEGMSSEAQNSTLSREEACYNFYQQCLPKGDSCTICKTIDEKQQGRRPYIHEIRTKMKHCPDGTSAKCAEFDSCIEQFLALCGDLI